MKEVRTHLRTLFLCATLIAVSLLTYKPLSLTAKTPDFKEKVIETPLKTVFLADFENPDLLQNKILITHLKTIDFTVPNYLNIKNTIQTLVAEKHFLNQTHPTTTVNNVYLNKNRYLYRLNDKTPVYLRFKNEKTLTAGNLPKTRVDFNTTTYRQCGRSNC